MKGITEIIIEVSRREYEESVEYPDGVAVVTDHPDSEELDEVRLWNLALEIHCRSGVALSWNTLQLHHPDQEALVKGNEVRDDMV